MRTYGCASRFGGTGDAGEVTACLWNPHPTRALYVLEIAWSNAGGAISPQQYLIQRTTTRGTAGGTIVPDGDSEMAGYGVAPETGALYEESNYTANPTIDTSFLGRWSMSGVVGAGVHLQWSRAPGCRVPPGTGLACVSVAAWTGGGELGFIWME